MTDSQTDSIRRERLFITLIQEARRRGGLILYEVKDDDGRLNPDLAVELRVWRKTLFNIPDEYLERAYEVAARDWDWLDDRKEFTPAAVAKAYPPLVKADREEKEAARRAEQKRNPDTVACWHCLDFGYQSVFYRSNGLWYSGARPCECAATPVDQRQPCIRVDAKTRTDGHWARTKQGEYAALKDLQKHGAPNDRFSEFAAVKRPPKVETATVIPIAPEVADEDIIF